MGVGLAFDDDVLVFVVPVDPYHGTQHTFGGRSRTGSRALGIRMNDHRCPRLGLRKRWNHWMYLVDAMANRHRGR